MFTHVIHTTIDITATAEDIWTLLTDFEAYPQWNPMLTKVQTNLKMGSVVRFEVALRDAGRSVKLKTHINVLLAPQALAWRGGFRPFLSGEHYFRIKKLDKKHCRFYHGERFTGFLVPLLKPLLKYARPRYEAMNGELKCLAEHIPNSNQRKSS